MRKMTVLTLCMGLLLLAGCDKNCSPEPDPCEVNPASCDTIGPVTKLDILWKVPLNTDTSNSIRPELRLIDRGLIVSHVSAQGPFINLFDIKENGKRIWDWQGYRTDRYIVVAPSQDQSLILCKDWGERATLTAEHGQTVQYVKSNHSSNPRGWIIGDRLFFDEYDDPETSAWLLMSSLSDIASVDTIYKLPREIGNGSRKAIESLNVWMDPGTGDSILIFQHRMSSPNRVDVVAWNMTQRRVEWQHNSLTKLGNSSTAQIHMLKDRAYFAGGTAFYCFDMRTGRIDWSYDHPSGINGFMLYETVYASDEDLLIVKDASDLLYAFRPETGQIAWQTKDAGQSSVSAGSPSYHDGIIYYCTLSRLYAVRAATGKVIWSERSPNRVTQPTFSGTVAVDPERGLLYACDQYYVMAIRLPE